MKEGEIQRPSGIGTLVSALCCLGLLGFVLATLGLTTSLAYYNSYGDYVFFPTYGAFGTVFAYSLLRKRRDAAAYALVALTVGLMVYLAASGLVGVVLIGSGVVLGGLVLQFLVRI